MYSGESASNAHSVRNMPGIHVRCCAPQAYKTFWQNFGRNIKLGCIEDQPSHSRLAPLLRFFSSQSGDEELTSLDEYVGRMKEGQKDIYYLAADTLKSAKSAPFLEALNQKNLEVSRVQFSTVLCSTVLCNTLQY